MTKKVAWTWAAAKVSSSVPVDGPGPSSKVRATHWSFAQLTVPPVGGCVGDEVVDGVEVVGLDVGGMEVGGLDGSLVVGAVEPT